jgi:hypothetical protein
VKTYAQQRAAFVFRRRQIRRHRGFPVTLPRGWSFTTLDPIFDAMMRLRDCNAALLRARDEASGA